MHFSPDNFTELSKYQCIIRQLHVHLYNYTTVLVLEGVYEISTRGVDCHCGESDKPDVGRSVPTAALLITCGEEG